MLKVSLHDMTESYINPQTIEEITVDRQVDESILYGIRLTSGRQIHVWGDENFPGTVTDAQFGAVEE